MANVRCINVLGGLYVSAMQRPAGAAAQPRRLAVLAMLAVAGERGVTRERLLTCLWPDNDEERGRHALTQALYALRRDLEADDLFLGQQELRLNPDLITSDYAAFHEALRSDAPERAIALYRGPFLQGFHLAGADNFARWAEEQRETLGHEYGLALEAAARQAAGRQDHLAAVGFLRKRAAQEPLNPRVAVKLMEALAAQGDVVSALQHARIYAALMQQELELPPDREVTALADRLRQRNGTAAAPPPGGDSAWARGQSPEVTVEAGNGTVPAQANGSPRASGAAAAAEAPETGVTIVARPAVAGAPATGARARRWMVLAAAGLLAVAATVLGFELGNRRAPVAANSAVSVVAIGPIRDYSGSPAPGVGNPLADMLATNLARSTGFRVISYGRMLELMRQLGTTGDSAEVVSAAARHAGATELIDGVLYTIAPGHYRLDVRRVDLASGEMIRAYTVRDTNLFALVDSGTADLVADLGGDVSQGSLAAASTSSVRAYQLYEEGLGKFHAGDNATAEQLFGQALELDPRFAQAAFYYGRATTSGSRTETLDRLRRAVELAKRASDRERLVVEAEWAAQNSSPTLAAIAETLVVRYPEEVDGYYYAGQGALFNGDYLKAVAPFRRAIELDSLGLRSAHDLRCRVCDAYRGLAYAYYAVDSSLHMRKVIRELVQRRPSAADGWRSLAQVYVLEHRRDSALLALRIADSLEPGNLMGRRHLISVRANNHEYAEAEQLLRSEMEGAPLAFRRQAQWDLAVVLRQMGRLREARPLAHDYRMGIRERIGPRGAPYNALLEGQILFEQGDYRAAASLFDSIAVGPQGGLDSAGLYRDRIWAWAHEADALAKLGDTARLTLLADSMEALGRSVGEVRERMLYAHVRGLLAGVRGRDEEAEGWFRRAMVSPVVGLTRTNYELAAIYLRTGRPAEAIRVLSPAVRAGTVGGSLYITRTELEARLAEAFDSVGQADSALTHYREVIRAWERADPQFQPRRDSIAAAVRRLAAAARR